MSFCWSDQRTSFSSSMINTLFFGMIPHFLPSQWLFKLFMVGPDHGERRRSGELERECRPATRLALDADDSLVLLHDGAGNRKTQTRPAMLGGVERREDFAEVLAADAGPGIADEDADVCPGERTAPLSVLSAPRPFLLSPWRRADSLGKFRPHRESPPLGHGLYGIEQNV